MTGRIARVARQLAVMFLFMIFCAGADAAEKRFALVIGNKTYAPNVGPLNNPVNDSDLIAATLTKIGYEVVSFPNAKRVDINREVGRLGVKLADAGENAIGFLYYSGHGVARAQDRTNYLIPVDVKDMSNEDFWHEAVSLDGIIRELVSSAPRASLFVVFDACRNELRLPIRSTAKGFESMQRNGVFIAFSTSPNESASDIGDTSGPYARSLAVELAKPGLDHVTLFQNVKEQVYGNTGSRQRPWESNGFVHRVYLSGKPANPVYKDDFTKPVIDLIPDPWFVAISSHPFSDRTSPEQDAREAAKKLRATMKNMLQPAIYRVGERHVVTISGPLSQPDAVKLLADAKALNVSATPWASDRVRGGKKVASCTEIGCIWVQN